MATGPGLTLIDGPGYRAPRIAQVLTAVGAIDEQVAGQILDDFRLALAARRAGSGGERIQQLMGLAAWRIRPAGAAPRQAHPPGPAGPRAAPGRIVPLGQMISFHGAEASGELHLLSYARAASGPQLSVFARARRQVGPWEPSGPHLAGPFTVTDDRGASYRVAIRDIDIASGPMGWTMMLYPDPPHDPRWLDLIPVPGGPAVRIDLDRAASGTRPPGAADVTVTKMALSPPRAPAAHHRGAAARGGLARLARWAHVARAHIAGTGTSRPRAR